MCGSCEGFSFLILSLRVTWHQIGLRCACPRPIAAFRLAQVAHTDVTLDDLWALDLQKLAGWRCVQENTAGEEAFQGEEGWETDSAGAGGEASGGGADQDEEEEEEDEDDEEDEE